MSPGDIRAAMRLKQRSCWWKPFQKNFFYGTDHLEPDLERVLSLYRGEGFVFARIEEARVRYLSPEWAELQIKVHEGDRIWVRETEVTGTDASMREKLLEGIVIEVGQPLREQELRKDEARLLETCGDAGFALAEINREMRFLADSAAVIYHVALRPLVKVRDIRIEGNVRTKTRVIRRELALRPTETFRLAKAIDTQDRLFELGLFRSVRILPNYADTTGWISGRDAVDIDLQIRVSEKPAGWYGLGFGYSSADRARLLAEWGYRNIQGRGRALRMLAEMSYQFQQGGVREIWEPHYEVTFTEPWLFDIPVRGQLSAYYRFVRESSFDEDIAGLALRAGWRPARFKRMVAKIENKRTWVFRSDDPDIPAEYDTRFLSLSFIEDSRDFILDPRRGSFSQAVGEYAGGFLGGVATFTRWTASYASYVPLGPRATWAYRLRAGYLHPINMSIEEASSLPELLDERFRAGGGTTVRGYREESLGPYDAEDPDQELGGLTLFLFNTELRFDLIGRIGAVLFIDGGNVWSDYHDIKASHFGHAWQRADYSELHVAYSVGSGLRFRTPVGPLRLDYGLKVGRAPRSSGPREWHLSLGQAF